MSVGCPHEVGMGKYFMAEPLYLEALSIDEQTLGINHPDYASSLNNLGVLYNDLGNYNKAEYYYLKALKIRKNIFEFFPPSCGVRPS